MSRTKGAELRLGMNDLGERSLRWRTRDLADFVSRWDGEWFSHFRAAGSAPSKSVEIPMTSAALDVAILTASQASHAPDERPEQGYGVFGHWTGGGWLDYL